MRTILISTLIIAASACVRAEDFRPETAKPVAGVPPLPQLPQHSEYKIETEGQRVAIVRVSSEGAFNSEEGTTIVHIRFELANHHNRPLTLASVNMASAETDEGPIANVPTMEQTGDLTVQPGSTGMSDVFFELPDEEVSPQNLDRFTIHWVIDGEGLGYSQDTSFVEMTETRPGRTEDDFFTSSPPPHPYGGEGQPVRFAPTDR